jgi:hypothetical protein
MRVPPYTFHSVDRNRHPLEETSYTDRIRKVTTCFLRRRKPRLFHRDEGESRFTPEGGHLAWRLCDLHIHTTPNEQDGSDQNPAELVAGCIDAGLDVIGITDHDEITRVLDVVEAAQGTDLYVVPGVEISTDRGHNIALAPGTDDVSILSDLIARIGAAPGSTARFDDLVTVVRKERRPNGETFSDHLVLIGSHVDQPGSLLANEQPLGIAAQLAGAAELDALEVVDSTQRDFYLADGVKQQGVYMPVIQSSDCHSIGNRVDRATWLYLPKIDHQSFMQALATPEASIRFGGPANSPTCTIESLEIEGGPFSGLRVDFCERLTAIIGPPSSGKSLVLDDIRWVTGDQCDIEEIAKTSDSRLAKCLPPGTIIRLVGRGPLGRFEIERTRGGTSAPAVPFKPIIFSQQELVRRGMESAPSMSLLDIHCSEAKGHMTKADRLTSFVTGNLES